MALTINGVATDLNSHADTLKQWWGGGKTPEELISAMQSLGIKGDIRDIANLISTASGGTTTLSPDDVGKWFGDNPQASGVLSSGVVKDGRLFNPYLPTTVPPVANGTTVQNQLPVTTTARVNPADPNRNTALDTYNSASMGVQGSDTGTGTDTSRTMDKLVDIRGGTGTTGLSNLPAGSGLPTSVQSQDMPDYITQPSLDMSGFLQDYYASMIDPNTGMIGGYGQNRVAGIDPLQQSALDQVPNAVGAWGGLFNQGANAMNLGLQRTGSLGQYDPNQMQRHLNPYIGGVLGQIEQLGNRNLTENTLPQVNSTFAGAGQFGSTRNADFTNRALRDNQQAISNAQGTALNQAYNQASQDYLNWDKSGQSSAGQLGVLGTGMTQSALAGGQQNWNDITNAYNAGANRRGIGQEGLTANYEDWQNQWKMPMDAMTSMGGILSQLKQGLTGTRYSASTPQSQDTSAPWYSALDGVLGSIFSGNSVNG